MICAIMQPHFLPGPRYFNLIANSDYFVFLDDVQYEKQSWQNRNFILMDGVKRYMTVPAKRNGLKGRILDARVSGYGEDHNWSYKHGKTIEQNYSNHPYFAEIESIRLSLADALVIFTPP